jgi:hypothetical protein
VPRSAPRWTRSSRRASAYGALVAFTIVLLPIAVAAGVPLRHFWSATKDPLLPAFSTASSGAALMRRGPARAAVTRARGP